jgi:hypothetical protein
MSKPFFSDMGQRAWDRILALPRDDRYPVVERSCMLLFDDGFKPRLTPDQADEMALEQYFAAKKQRGLPGVDP